MLRRILIKTPSREELHRHFFPDKKTLGDNLTLCAEDGNATYRVRIFRMSTNTNRTFIEFEGDTYFPIHGDTCPRNIRGFLNYGYHRDVHSVIVVEGIYDDKTVPPAAQVPGDDEMLADVNFHR